MGTEAEALTLLVFAVIALAPMIASFAVPRGKSILSLAGAGGWLILGVYCYDNSVETWDILYGVFWLSMIMVMAGVYMAVIMRDKKEEGFDTDSTEDPVLRNIREGKEDKVQHSTVFREKKSTSKDKPSKFGMTGRYR